MKEFAYLLLAASFCVVGCTDTQNPVTSKNNRPVLVLDDDDLGFGSSVLVFQSGKAYPFTFRVTDADNHDLFVSARVLNSTGSVEIGSPLDDLYTGSFHPNDVGSHTVRITVSDRIDSVSGSLSVNLGLLVATPRLSPSNEMFNGQELMLDGQQSQSPHGSISSYTWLLRNNGGVVERLVPTETGATLSNPFRWTVLAPVGQYNIGLAVTDVETQSDTSWLTFTVKNSVPVGAFQVETDPDEILEKIIVTTYEATDPDPGDSLGLAVSWRLNGTPLPAFNGFKLPTLSSKGGVQEVTQVVTDQHGGIGEFTRQVDVRGLPEARFVFPNNATSFAIINDTTITINATTSIPGHLSQGIERYVWYQRRLNGVTTPIDSGSVLNSLLFDIDHVVGVHEVGLKIVNREGLSTLILWQQLDVVNSLPEAYFEVDINCSPSGQCAFQVTLNGSTDRDPQDQLTYDWYRNCLLTDTHVATPNFGAPLDNPINSIMLIVRDQHGGEGRFTFGDACPP